MIINLTKQNQQEVEAGQKPVIIDVFATWCGPCMEMKPIFEDLADKLGDKYTFAELNVDEARELAIHYGVTSVPAFIFIKQGKIQGKEIGYMAREDLLEKINEYLG